LAVNGQPSLSDVRGDPFLLPAGRARPMDPTDLDRRQPTGLRVRHLPVRQPAPSASVGADTSDTTGLWSLAVAIAHGAGLMLLPIYLSLCAADLRGGTGGTCPRQCQCWHGRLGVRHPLCRDDRARGLLAWPIYRYLGLRFLSRSWFNLDATWPASLTFLGAL